MSTYRTIINCINDKNIGDIVTRQNLIMFLMKQEQLMFIEEN